jgi:alkylation response protein AidB-like acyl-CoA dehydrogenase
MISFQPTDDQKEVINTIRRYVKERVEKIRLEANENRALPENVVKEGWGLGLSAAYVPEEFGGLGDELSAISNALYAEELGYGDASLALQLLAPGSVGIPVLKFGTPEQKERFLAALADDKMPKFAAAWVEPDWDYDLINTRTTATQDGSNYVINGNKAWVIGAPDAEVILVYAKVGDAVQAFLVEKGTPGLIIGDREKNMGFTALPTYEISLQNCVVPGTALLGGEGGCNVCQLLPRTRLALAAIEVGVAKAAFEIAMNYAKERQAFGRAIAQFQSIAFFLAEMLMDIEAARLMVWEAAYKLDKGEDALQATAIAKQFADETALMVTDRAVQIFGGHGYIRDNQVEMFLRNARAFAVINGAAII